jgi:tRNA-specific 2-thiouridylase
LDLSDEYKKDVVDYMIGEYKIGRTPNPDVMCNKYIKFGGFFDFAMKKGADFVATGHYARVVRIKNKELRIKEKENRELYLATRDPAKRDNFKLLTSRDNAKDQSYFLWTLKEEHLAKTLFPVGGMQKSEVRKLAKKFDLVTAEKKDSQGLCFMGKIDVKDFLSHYIKPKVGKVLDEKGQEIGFHSSVTFLTIGERHGFTITKKTANDKPYFIVGKNIKDNVVIVSNNKFGNNTENQVFSLKLKNLNIINPNIDIASIKNLEARLRYRQPVQRLKIKDLRFKNDRLETIEVEFETPQVVAPGQSLVFYNGEECLGGGIIV